MAILYLREDNKGAATFVGCLIVSALLGGCQSTIPEGLTTYAGVESSSRARSLQLRYYGTSTIALTEPSGETVLIDGFFSRPKWIKFVVSMAPDRTRIEVGLAQVRNVKAIFVAHAHHDHSMDAGVVATIMRPEKVYGSKSALNVVRGTLHAPTSAHPWPELVELTENENGERIVDVGDRMKVRVFATPHSGTPLFPGLIDKPLLPGARLWHYRYDINYSFTVTFECTTVLIVPSGGVRLREGYTEVRASVVLLGSSGVSKPWRSVSENYKAVGVLWKQAVVDTKALAVLPIHWDDFTRPLEPIRTMPGFIDNIGFTIETMKAMAMIDGVMFAMPPVGKAIELPVDTRGCN